MVLPFYGITILRSTIIIRAKIYFRAYILWIYHFMKDHFMNDHFMDLSFYEGPFYEGPFYEGQFYEGPFYEGPFYEGPFYGSIFLWIYLFMDLSFYGITILCIYLFYASIFLWIYSFYLQFYLHSFKGLIYI